MRQEQVDAFEFRRMILPEEFDYWYLGEVAIRTLFMFLLVLIFFKLSGKRSINQLSLFELALIVGLGSAAGDPMFYHDVGLLPILIVFTIISLLYKGLTYLTAKNETAELIMEGKIEPLLLNDLLITDNLDSEALSYDEFFGFLRVLHIEHLGQVKAAYLEVTGNISVFFYPENEVKPGLPILPEALKFTYIQITSEGFYSCTKCGNTVSYKAGMQPQCTNCNNNIWVRSISTQRIA